MAAIIEGFNSSEFDGRSSIPPEMMSMIDNTRLEGSFKSPGKVPLSSSQKVKQPTALQQVRERNEDASSDDDDEDGDVPSFNDLISQSQKYDLKDGGVNVPSMEDLIEEAKIKDSN